MNFKLFLDEALSRGAKIKDDVLNELFKSKTIKELANNKTFIHAITRILETKEEAKKAIDRQVKNIFDTMNVPTKKDLRDIGRHITRLEKIVERIGRRKIKVKPLAKKTTRKRRKTPKRMTVGKTK